MKKQIITMGAVGLAVAGSAVSAKADETADVHTSDVTEQQVQTQATTEQKMHSQILTMQSRMNNRLRQKPTQHSPMPSRQIRMRKTQRMT